VTWIDGTDAFIVTTGKDSAGNLGGIWRVTLAPGGTGTVEDLTPTLPTWIEARFADADYDAAVRMRLDTALLPKPFQLSALTGRDLQLDSPWKRFIVRPPR